MKLLIVFFLILLQGTDQGPDLKTVPLPPAPSALIYPQNMEIVTNTDEKLEFLWTSAGGDFDYRFELATDRDFRRLEYDLISPECHIPAPRLSPGTWYWRISARNSLGLTGLPTKANMFIYSPFEGRP